MSDEPGSPNPFEGFPLFGDLAKLFGQAGRGVPWDAARNLALAVATDNTAEPNVDPLERMKLEQLARVAELHVTNVTGLSASVTGRGLTVAPVTRGHWAQRTLEDYRPLLEKLAGSLGAPDPGAAGPGAGAGLPADPDDPFSDPEDQLAAMLGPMIQAMQPMMVAMTAGSMVGHLAQRSLGQYDLPVPRPPSDELLILVRNLDEFGAEWSLPPDDLRLWICLHEIAHHTVLGVPHVRARLESLLGQYTTKFRNDPGALEQHLGDLDLAGGPESLARIQQALSEPGALLGAIQSDEQRALLPHLETIVALVVGVVDHVMDTVGHQADLQLRHAHRGAAPAPGRDGGVRPVRRAADGPGADPGRLRPGRGLRGGRHRAGGRRGPGPAVGEREDAAQPARDRGPRPVAGPHRPPRRRLTAAR